MNEQASHHGHAPYGSPDLKDRRYIIDQIYAREPERLTHDITFVHNLVFSTPYIPSGPARPIIESIIQQWVADERRKFANVNLGISSEDKDVADIETFSSSIGKHVKNFIVSSLISTKGASTENNQYNNTTSDSGKLAFEDYERQSFHFNSNSILSSAILRYERHSEVYRLTLIFHPKQKLGRVHISEWFSNYIPNLDAARRDAGLIDDNIFKSGAFPFDIGDIGPLRLPERLEDLIENSLRHRYPMRSAEYDKAEADLLRAQILDSLQPNFVHSWKMVMFPVEFLINPLMASRLDAAVDEYGPSLKAKNVPLLEIAHAPGSAPAQLAELAHKRTKNIHLRELICALNEGTTADIAENSPEKLRRDWERVLFELCKPLLQVRFGKKNEIIGSRLSGCAYYYSDFRLLQNIETSAFIIDCGLTTYQRGRLVQRLCDISTFRVAALLHGQAWRFITATLQRYGRGLDSLVQDLIPPSESASLESILPSTREAVNRVSKLYAAITDLNSSIRGGITFRAAAAGFYFSIVSDRLSDLRESRLVDLCTVGMYIRQYLSPFMKSVERVSTRYDVLRSRCEETLTILGHDLELRQGQRNLDIQDAIEKWAIVPVSYYSWSLGRFLWSLPQGINSAHAQEPSTHGDYVAELVNPNIGGLLAMLIVIVAYYFSVLRKKRSGLRGRIFSKFFII